MKKITTAIVFSALFFTVKAQVSFGPKAGLNISMVKFNSPTVTVTPAYPSFYAGGFVNYSFTRNIAAQVELFFSGEGTKYKNKGNSTVFTDKLSYLNLPILVRYNTGGFYLETGPQLGFLLSASQTDNGTSQSIKNNINATKFSWCFGLGYQFMKTAGIGIRYAAGLSNINKNSSGTNVKGSVISLGLSYAIHLKKLK